MRDEGEGEWSKDAHHLAGPRGTDGSDVNAQSSPSSSELLLRLQVCELVKGGSAGPPKGSLRDHSFRPSTPLPPISSFNAGSWALAMRQSPQTSHRVFVSVAKRLSMACVGVKIVD
ncbi:hypothetical protein ACOMHN_025817 [Nucella lapillus]